MVSIYGFTERKARPSIILSLLHNICECVRHLTVTDIGRIDKLQVITDKLDEIYLRNKHTKAYMAFKDFYSNKKTTGVNINDFLILYNFLY